MPLFSLFLVKAVKFAASLRDSNTDIRDSNTDTSVGESGTGTPWSTENMGDSGSSSFDASDAADSDSIGDIISSIIDFIF
jgi:hypothetical protein